ncbi:MAG: TIGR04076 family protein [Bacillota bacterium]
MKVIVTVENVMGHCNVGHKQGDRVVFNKTRGTKTRMLYLDTQQSCRRICVHALSAIYPFIFAEKTWRPEEPVDYYRCPDPGADFCGKGSIIFRVDRGTEAEDGDEE